MKKITTQIFVCLLFISSAMAANSSGKKLNGTTRHVNPNSTLTVPFYSEDFAAGLPGTWQNIDNGSPANVLWRYTTTGAKKRMGSRLIITCILQVQLLPTDT
ncbi:MAG: hypothetical protein NTV09_04070 [Bacteroidetes bacterium]|nr:hypothetical protein [Bacteroidota bacterium]